MTAIKTATTGRLEIGYLDEGEAAVGTALLLHGWPDDPHGWDAVAPALTRAGWRVVRPWLRGFGPTRFLDDGPRNGDLSALAGDVLGLVDALDVERVAMIGHDWGARAAYIVACAAPERVTHCAALSVGWATNDPDQRLSLTQVQNYWYHWYMALDRGARLVRDDRRTFTRYIWDLWSVARPLDAARFDEMAVSFDTADWAEVVIHSYRVRWGLAEPGPDGAELAAKVAADATIAVPALMLHGGADPCNAPTTSEGKERWFSGPYRRVVLDGVGHFPQWEAPEETARLLTEFLGTER